MKPLNRAERANAFLRFLLLFIITVGLIVAVVFYSIRVPFKESERLRQKVSALQDEKDISDSFKVMMLEAMADLDGSSGKKGSPEAINRRVQDKTVEMNAWLRKMPNGENSVYALMIRNLSDLSEAKKILSKAKLEFGQENRLPE